MNFHQISIQVNNKLKYRNQSGKWGQQSHSCKSEKHLRSCCRFRTDRCGRWNCSPPRNSGQLRPCRSTSQRRCLRTRVVRNCNRTNRMNKWNLKTIDSVNNCHFFLLEWTDGIQLINRPTQLFALRLRCNGWDGNSNRDRRSDQRPSAIRCRAEWKWNLQKATTEFFFSFINLGIDPVQSGCQSRIR